MANKLTLVFKRRNLMIAAVVLSLCASHVRADPKHGMGWVLSYQSHGITEWYARVPGGVLVKSARGPNISIAYFPDPSNSWNPVSGAFNDLPTKFDGTFVQVTATSSPGGGPLWIAVDKIISIQNIQGKTTVKLQGAPDVTVKESTDEILLAIRQPE